MAELSTQQLKQLSSPNYSVDISGVSRDTNPWLKNFGKDRLTYSAENPHTSAIHWRVNEPLIAYGQPYTSWLQIALIYGCGLYTAKEQGIVRKGVFFKNFWRAHYFDWILFARRGAIYGYGGGLVVGTLVFGCAELAQRRILSKYHYLFSMPKPDKHNMEAHYHAHLNG